MHISLLSILVAHCITTFRHDLTYKENVEHLHAAFDCSASVYIIQRSTFGVQPWRFALCKWRTEKGWLVMYFIVLPHLRPCLWRHWRIPLGTKCFFATFKRLFLTNRVKNLAKNISVSLSVSLCLSVCLSLSVSLSLRPWCFISSAPFYVFSDMTRCGLCSSVTVFMLGGLLRCYCVYFQTDVSGVPMFSYRPCRQRNVHVPAGLRPGGQP